MVTLAEILALIPNYIGAFAGIGALVVAWLAYRRSKSTKNESDAIALILAETLRELAKPEQIVVRDKDLADAMATTGAAEVQLIRGDEKPNAYAELSAKLAQSVPSSA